MKVTIFDLSQWLFSLLVLCCENPLIVKEFSVNLGSESQEKTTNFPGICLEAVIRLDVWCSYIFQKFNINVKTK